MAVIRTARLLSSIAFFVVAMSLTWWAAVRTNQKPTSIPKPSSDLAFYTVSTGQISETLPVLVVGLSEAVANIRSGQHGIVTYVSDEPALGDVLLRINEMPVVVIASEIPFYRDIGRGDSGRDVFAIQEFLRSLGMLESDSDGQFGPATAQAVRLFQQNLGLDETGIVDQGLFVADWSISGVLHLEAEIGDSVALGDQIATVVSSKPQFSIPRQGSERTAIPTGLLVLIEVEGDFIEARTEMTVSMEGAELVLLSSDFICENSCSLFSSSDSIRMNGTVVVQDEMTGVLVPLAAITSHEDGRTSVLLKGGERRKVEVIGMANGNAIVSGIVDGDQVALPSSP